MNQLTEQELEGLSRPRPLGGGKSIKITNPEENGNALVPMGIWDNRELLFPLRADSEQNMEIIPIETADKILRVWSREIKNKSVIYYCFTPRKNPPRFGRDGSTIYYALLAIQTEALRENKAAHRIYTTRTTVLRKAKLPVTKTNLRYVNEHLETLALTLYEVTNGDSGDCEQVGNLISYKNPSNKLGFYFWANEGHAELLANEKLERCTNYPSGLIQGRKNLTKEELKIAEYLVELRGLKNPYPIKIKTLFLKKGGYKRRDIENEHPEEGKFYLDFWNKMIKCGLMNKFPTAKPSGKSAQYYSEKGYLEWKIYLDLT